MSEPFLAEVRIFSFNFPPRNWAFCDGQILPINQNQSLYSLLGTTYGGDGRTSFALPELRGRMPMHAGNGFTYGAKSGSETHTLTAAQMPTHTHQVKAADEASTTPLPADNLLGQATATDPFYAGIADTPSQLGNDTLNSSDGQFNIMQPYLALNFCIAITGLFPSRN